MSRTDIDTGTEQCLAYETDGIAVITLNRPQARNAITDPMKAGLGVALDYAVSYAHLPLPTTPFV